MTDPLEEFAVLLRRLRAGAGLTQEELAEASGVSPRSVSDLERGKVAVPHKDTVRQLADALHLTGPVRAQFEAIARGRTRQAGVAVARTLPRDVISFTGRQRELTELVDAAVAASGVVSIHAIGGMAGVGKTAFAVHAAHRLADRFPGGQIFLSLHGHTPGQQPVDPADALASLLLTIGVQARQIPLGLGARMALWRDRLASQELLLILDDAIGSEQVLPLVPGAGGSLVLVTSRRHLSALEDVAAISLDTLPAEDGAALLVRLTGRPGLSTADPAVPEIVRLCGFLPLAIGLMARQLHSHPAWSLSRRAAELAAERDRLEPLATENVSVGAAFDLSYADLVPGRQRLFRRLGLHPGSEWDAYAAAALDGTGLAAARQSLEALYDRYLLTEPEPGRYRMHDLIKEHARALAGRLDPDHDRDQAAERLLDYYQHAAARANALITIHARPAAPAQGVPRPASIPGLAGQEQALAWARAERASLLACLDHATSTGLNARVVVLTAGIAGLLRRDGPWADAVIRHSAAIHAAQSLADRLGQAGALTDLGDVCHLMGDYPAAMQAQEEALGIYRDFGDRLGQANALHFLGVVRYLVGDFPAAIQAQEEALGIYRDFGDRLGQANALRYLGGVWYQTDKFPAAVQALDEALGIYRELGDRLGQASVLNYLGGVRYVTSDFLAATQALDEALGIYRDLGDRRGQANALNYLGVSRCQLGDFPAATQALDEALGICRDLGYRLGAANALIGLAEARRATGDYLTAARAVEEALGIYRELGDRLGLAMALNEAGTLHRVAGDLALAEGCHQESLDVSRDIGSSSDEGHALAGLGRCARAAGDGERARSLLRQALDIFQRIGAPVAAEVTAELDVLR